MNQKYFEIKINKMFIDYYKIYGDENFSLTINSKKSFTKKWTIFYFKTGIEHISTSSLFSIEILNNEIVLQVNTSKANFSFEKFKEIFSKVELLLKGWLERQNLNPY